MSTVSFPGIKWPGPIVDYPPLSVADVKEKVELYIYSTSGTSGALFIPEHRINFYYYTPPRPRRKEFSKSQL
jgi:hypothetical protein